MSSLYSTSLKLELIGTGDQTGIWGGTTNTNLGTALEQAIVGKASLVTGDFTANVATLLLTDTNASQTARAFVLDVTATLSAAGTINVPAVQKPYIVFNNTVGGFALTVKVSGLTGVVVPNGRKAIVYNNGTDVGDAITYLSSLTLGAPLPLASGGTGLSAFTAGDLPYYSTGTALSKLPVGAANTVVTSSGMAPQYVAQTTLVVGGLSGGTTGAVPYQTAPSTTGFLAVGAVNTVLTSSGTAPQYVAQSTLAVGTATNVAGGTTGAIPYQTAPATTGLLTVGAANTVLTSSGTAPQYVAQSTLAVGTATNVAGGTANQLLVQSGAGATSFAPAPTFAGYVLSWDGTALAWAVAPAAISTVNIVGGSAGVLPYQSATSTTAFTAVGVSGKPLVSTGTGAPAFATLGISGGGTNSTDTPTAGSVGYGTGTAHGYTLAGTAGQYLQSSGTGTPIWAALVIPASAAQGFVTQATGGNTPPGQASDSFALI